MSLDPNSKYLNDNFIKAEDSDLEKKKKYIQAQNSPQSIL